MLRKLKRTNVYLGILATILIVLYLRNSQSNTRDAQSLPVKGASRLLSLSEDQCTAAFPGLNKEIENAVAQGPFKLKKLRGDTQGLVQGRVKNGKLYIISAAQENSLHRVSAILHSIHRAIVTSPTPLPDTIFSLSINDTPQPNSWSFSRSDDDLSPNAPWLMPHYSYWSWPMEPLGPIDDALGRIDKVEEDTRWETKIDKAVWRGTPWYSPNWRPGLRLMLVEVGKGQQWADVEGWGEGQNNTLSIEDFCKYKYIIYAEGKSYSGRLPYHQACRSIILTPPPTFLLHNTNLLRPVFSSLLPLSSTPRRAHPKNPTAPSLDSYPLPATSKTWPLSYPPDSANIIFIQPDWADIDIVIEYLRTNPSVAEGIAGRQRQLMVDGGYLSEGAEVCYWRSLLRAWSQVIELEDEGEWGEGMRWETYSLLGKMSYEEMHG